MAFGKIDCNDKHLSLETLFMAAFEWDPVTNCARLVAETSGVAAVAHVIDFVEETLDGSTDAAVQSVSLLFEGTGGSLNGVSVPDGFKASYSANGSGTVNAIAFIVPTAGAVTRVLVSYVR